MESEASRRITADDASDGVVVKNGLAALGITLVR
jgi:hypothetical protein